MWLADRFTRGQAWVDLLMSAAHVDHEVTRGGRVVNVKRGQVFGSQAALAARWKWTRETVSVFLKHLQRSGMAADISTVRGAGIGYTLITISNYEVFQSGPARASDISSDIFPAICPDISSDIQKNGSTRSKEEKNPSEGPHPVKVKAIVAKAPAAAPRRLTLAEEWAARPEGTVTL
jgi:DNA replication protein DnaD